MFLNLSNKTKQQQTNKNDFTSKHTCIQTPQSHCFYNYGVTATGKLSALIWKGALHKFHNSMVHGLTEDAASLGITYILLHIIGENI